ncbi:MAG: NAD(P)H-binding protein [Terracidiphilus sp.]
MNVLLFGATGMVGQGVLRECLLDPAVDSVVAIGRAPSGRLHSKLREILHGDFTDYKPIESQLTGFDACFFCLGVTSAGKTEEQYTRITYDFTMSAAETLARLNPGMTFVFVTGLGTDSSEKGRVMWARVKGRTENALLRLPFKAAHMFRPGFIEPRFGVLSRTGWYRAAYAVTRPLFPVLRGLFPNHVLATDEIGRAMLIVARDGAPKPVLEARDIRALLRVKTS